MGAFCWQGCGILGIVSGKNSLQHRLREKVPQNRLAATKQPVIGRGKVRFRLDEFCRERGLVVQHGPHQGKPNRQLVQRLTGVSDDTLFYMLRYPETVQNLYLTTLARLCHGLECSPGDLIVYEALTDAPAPLSEQYKQAPTWGLDE